MRFKQCFRADLPKRLGLATRKCPGLGGTPECAGEHRLHHPNNGGVGTIMGKGGLHGTASTRTLSLRSEHRALLARMPPERMQRSSAKAEIKGIQACGQAVAHPMAQPCKPGHLRKATLATGP